MKRVTVYDIARELGISPSTVSRVLNNSVLISDEKRNRILETAERMGYRKRPIRKQSSRAIINIILYLPYMEDDFIHLFYDIAALLSGLKEGFGETRVNIVTELNDSSTGVFDNKKLGDIDGIVSAFTLPDDKAAAEIRERNVPLVLLNRIDEEGNYIAYDSADGMARLLSAVLGKRPRLKPCYLGFSPVAHVSEARRTGLRNACRKEGIPFSDDDVYVLKRMKDIDGPFLEMLLQKGYDGIFCFNDVMAVYLYQLARELKLRIPDRFSLTGYDCSPVRNLMPQAVDTIQLSVKKLGLEAGNWLRSRIIERSEEPLRKKIHGEYVPGGSI